MSKLILEQAIRDLNKKRISLNENKNRVTFAKISEEDEVYESCKSLKEDVNSSFPVSILSEDAVIDFVMSIPVATKGYPLKKFKLGYIKEVKAVSSKYKGGRGSVNKETGEVNSKVRIFKCTEYSSVETAVNPRTTRAGLEADKKLGIQRHTGEKTGFKYTEDEKAFRIGEYPDGAKALQACINSNNKEKIKYFISIDDGNLTECDAKVVSKYLTPTEAAKLNAPTVRKASVLDDAGNEVFDKPIKRFKLDKIYMIGNLGKSIF